jgi:uncharacterized protein YidB (DUF937 family)
MALLEEGKMGTLQQILSAFTGKSADQASPMAAIITTLLSGDQTGGLDGLVQKFQGAGLGDIVSSWIGTGENRPISPDQLGQVLGDSHVSQLAEQAGMPRDQLLGELSQHLPGLVDKMTPQGEIPQGGLADTVLGLLKGKLAST